MASFQELYNLCHSMNKAEKRFTSLFVKGMAGKSKENYLLQLDNIWQTQDFDETKLKERSQNISTKRISEFNSNLFDFISKGLVIYYADKNDSFHLAKEAILSEIYLRKGLLTSAAKHIHKELEEQNGYGNNELLLHFQKLQYKLGLKEFSSFSKQINLLDQKLDMLEVVKSETVYQKLNFEMNNLFVSTSLPRTKKQSSIFEAFLERDLLIDSTLALSNYAKHYYYMIKIPLLNIVGRHKEALALSNEGIEFAREHFDVKKDPIPLFLQLKRNLSLHFALENADMLLPIIDDIKKIIRAKPELSKRIDIWSVELDAIINKAMLEKKYKEGIAYFEKNAKEKLDKEFEQVNRLDAKALLIARIYFMDHNYKESIKYAELVSKGNQYKFKYAIIAAQFLILINHYKLGNKLMLPYAVQSLKRALQHEDILYAPEKALLSFLGKITNPDNIPKELKKLREIFLKEQQNPLNGTFFGNGDYISWLNDEIPLKY